MSSRAFTCKRSRRERPHTHDDFPEFLTERCEFYQKKLTEWKLRSISCVCSVYL